MTADLTPKYLINDYNSDNGDHEVRETTADELAHIFSKSVSEMERVIKYNIDAIEKYTNDQNGGLEAYAVVNIHGASQGYTTAVLTRNAYSGVGRSSYSRLMKVKFPEQRANNSVGEISPEYFMTFTEDLADIMKHHADVIRQLQSDKGVPTLKTDRMLFEFSEDGFNVSKLSVLYKCPNCGKDTKAISITRHMAGQQCLVDTASRDVRDSGYEELIIHKHLGSVIKANVGAQPRPKEYTYWVQPWVNEAIQQFEKHPGFAGLSLSEYLAKMGTDKQTGN